MAFQSQKGIYWLDLADTIWWNLGQYIILIMAGVLVFLDGDCFFIIQLAGHSAHNNILFSYIEIPVWCMSAPMQTFAVSIRLGQYNIHDIQWSTQRSIELEMFNSAPCVPKSLLPTKARNNSDPVGRRL